MKRRHVYLAARWVPNVATIAVGVGAALYWLLSVTAL